MLTFLQYLIIGVIEAMDTIGDLQYYSQQYRDDIEEEDIFGTVGELLNAGYIAYDDDIDIDGDLWDRIFVVTATGKEAAENYF